MDTDNRQPNAVPSNQPPRPATPPQPSIEPVEPVVVSGLADQLQPTQPLPPTPIDQPQSQFRPQPTPKRKHTGRIVALIILIVVLLGIAGAVVWYFAIYSAPERVALDAANNLINAKNLTVSTTAEYQNRDNSQTLNIESNLIRGLPTEHQVSYQVTSEGQTINLSLGAITTNDGTIYLHPDGLNDLLALFASSSGVEVPAEVTEFFNGVDGFWFQLDADSLTKYLNEEFNFEAETYIKPYSCAMEAASHPDDYSTELAKIYQQHPFMQIVKAGAPTAIDTSDGTTYRLTINTNQLTDAVRALSSSKLIQDIATCANVNTPDSSNISESDFEYLTEDWPNVLLNVSNWGHRLNTAQISDDQTSLQMQFKYPDSLDVNLPNEYTPVTDLLTKYEQLMLSQAADADLTVSIPESVITS